MVWILLLIRLALPLYGLDSTHQLPSWVVQLVECQIRTPECVGLNPIQDCSVFCFACVHFQSHAHTHTHTCPGGPRLDDAGLHGGSLPGGSLPAATEQRGLSTLHRPSRAHSVRLSHHYDRGQAVTQNVPRTLQPVSLSLSVIMHLFLYVYHCVVCK